MARTKPITVSKFSLNEEKKTKKKLGKKAFLAKKKIKSTEKKIKRDLRCFYRRAYHEVALKTDSLKKMSPEAFITYLKNEGIKFDKDTKEIKEISENEGLLNFTMVYIPEDKKIKIEAIKNLVINDLVFLKKDLLNNESPSIYSNRTLSSITESLKDDNNIKKYEKERKKNILIKCRELYARETGESVPLKDFSSFCQTNGIEIPNQDYDRTVFSFMLTKFYLAENYFGINRSSQKSENLRLFNKDLDFNKLSIPTHTALENVEWDIEGIIGYKKKELRIFGLCAWSPIEGENFEPTWEPLINIMPGTEQDWEIKSHTVVHVKDLQSAKQALKYYKK